MFVIAFSHFCSSFVFEMGRVETDGGNDGHNNTSLIRALLPTVDVQGPSRVVVEFQRP